MDKHDPSYTPPASGSPLPPRAAWTAQSFWAMIVASLTSFLAAAFGFDLPGFFGYSTPDGLVTGIMGIVAGVLVIYGWYQRMAPRFQLFLRRFKM